MIIDYSSFKLKLTLKNHPFLGEYKLYLRYNLAVYTTNERFISFQRSQNERVCNK